jgi:protein-tyrosine phosphatase
MSNASYRVLFVCMGNICRSPAGEAVFLDHLQATDFADQVVVDSAGTIGYHANSPADARMQAHAARRGYQLLSRARQVVAADFDEFDLIVAMDRDNLADLTSQCPAAGAGRLRLFCEFVEEQAGVTDVPDPYYGGDAGFERVLDLLEDGVRGLLDYVEQQVKRDV